MNRILVFGDSNVAGWQANCNALYSSGISFASKLELVHPNFSAHGTPGLKATDAVLSDVAGVSLLILMIGVNDLEDGNVPGAINAINHLFSSAEPARRLYIVHPGIRFDRLYGMWSDMFGGAQEAQNEFFAKIGNIQADLVDLRGMDLLGDDGLHLTAEGHQRVFDLVNDRIKSMSK